MWYAASKSLSCLDPTMLIAISSHCLVFWKDLSLEDVGTRTNFVFLPLQLLTVSSYSFSLHIISTNSDSNHSILCFVDGSIGSITGAWCRFGCFSICLPGDLLLYYTNTTEIAFAFQ